MDREDSVAASRDQDARPQTEANASATPLRERIARLISPHAEWGRAPSVRFKGHDRPLLGGWDQHYVWDAEYSAICNPDGPRSHAYPWRRMETSEQSIAAAQALNAQQDAWWVNSQQDALAKADAILALISEDGSHHASEPREDAQRRATPDLPQGDA